MAGSGRTRAVSTLGSIGFFAVTAAGTVAVPLRNYRGETVAALNVSVQATRMTVDQLVQTALPPLLQTQAQLRQLL